LSRIRNEINHSIQPVDLNRAYLHTVLSWLDVRLEIEIRRWQLSGQNPADRFRGLYISDTEALTLAQRGAGTHWGTGIQLPEGEEIQLEEALKIAEEEIQSIEKAAEKDNLTLRLKALRDIFELSAFEFWAFVVCIAPSLDLRYERIYSYLQDDVTRVFPSVDLILHVLLPEGFSRLDHLSYFENGAPLHKFRLLITAGEDRSQSSGLRRAFQAAPGVVDWLLGSYSPATALGSWAEYFPVTDDDTEIDSAGSIFGSNGIPEANVFTTMSPLVSLFGEDLLQQELTVRQIATGLGKSLLKIKIEPEENLESSLDKLYAAVRDARMLKALLYIQGFDVFIDQDGCLCTPAFTALQRVGDSVILTSQKTFRLNPDVVGNDYPLMRVAFQKPSAGERLELWQMLLEGILQDMAEKELEILAGQFSLTSGQIVAATSSAMSQAVQENRPLESLDLFEAARLHSGHHLSELAQKIEPRYSWEDLVLPQTPLNMLRELVSMVQTRPLVLDSWGLGRKLTASTGVSALFSGPPGTGKTLAAQIIANQLGIELYRIDLSTVVSKYVGETEKNLERIFTEASQSNAILFFDEADAIFGKRSEVKDAHDRYANIEVGYLLQRMENYNGVAVLATNLRANLDEAFTRRLQFIINFPFPDEKYRLRIWQVLMPQDLPRSGDLDLELMAKRFKLAGGNIRNIIVSAAFNAASNGEMVTMEHLMHGARREIQKMGRLVHESDYAL
jgi:hypothetical protein